jgi:AMMECR1 domain-containing protein
VEQGWNLDEYLDYICVKAGLPPGSYGEPGARLFTFTAVVFGEGGGGIDRTGGEAAGRTMETGGRLPPS